VTAPVIKISKEDSATVGGAVAVAPVAVAPVAAVAPFVPVPNVMIDTEPSVHFTPYDTVFDETTQGISHIRYSPKDGDGNDDGYDAPPRLSFGTTANAIVAEDAEDLEPVRGPTPVIDDVDAPLGTTEDFEVLA
jgi:hypothetical protein